MALRKLERRNYGGKSLVSIKHQNLHTFKEVLILSCHSILETRRITHLPDSAHFRIPLKRCATFEVTFNVFKSEVILFNEGEVLNSYSATSGWNGLIQLSE